MQQWRSLTMHPRYPKCMPVQYKSDNWLTVWLPGWLTDWQVDWLTVWLTDLLAHWLTDWLTGYWRGDLVTDWLTDWLLANWRSDWLTTDWFTDWRCVQNVIRFDDSRIFIHSMSSSIWEELVQCRPMHVEHMAVHSRPALRQEHLFPHPVLQPHDTMHNIDFEATGLSLKVGISTPSLHCHPQSVGCKQRPSHCCTVKYVL